MSKTVPILSLTLLLAMADYQPARFRSGPLVTQPQTTVGGGQVLLDLTVGPSGQVAKVATLRATPPYTDLLRSAVAGWVFESATLDGQAVESRVLVAGVFRAPTLYTGPTLGEAPQDVVSAPPEIAFPTSVSTPAYPAEAYGDAVVLVEILVGTTGTVEEARIVRSAPGFDQVSIEAARGWRFRPARREGSPRASYAYALFGFRNPVVSPPPPP